MNRNRTIWILLLLFLLAMCCCLLLVFGLVTVRTVGGGELAVLGYRVQATEDFQETVPLEGPAVLRIDVPVGDIAVRVGDAGQVAIQGTRRAWGATQAGAEENLRDVQVRVEASAGGLGIRATGLDNIGNIRRSPSVDLVVTVPAATTLTVEGRVGNVSVTGTQGDASIVWDVGDVSLNDVIPKERLEVQTRVATIEMAGPLTPGAAYRLTSDVGRIALLLPADSSFAIDARSDIGSVRVSFPVQGRDTREGFVGEQVVGTVGSSPDARLDIGSRLGDISVRPR